MTDNKDIDNDLIFKLKHEIDIFCYGGKEGDATGICKRYQPSDEASWLAWRQQRICASDIPVILGQSPHKTSHELFLEKTGAKEAKKCSYKERFVFTPAKEAEYPAIQHYISTELGKNSSDVRLETQVCLEFDRLGATLDGVVYKEENGRVVELHIVEVKCVAAEPQPLPENKFVSQVGLQALLLIAYMNENKRRFSEAELFIAIVQVYKEQYFIQTLDADELLDEINTSGTLYGVLKETARLSNAIAENNYELFMNKPDGIQLTRAVLPKTKELEVAYIRAERALEAAQEELEKAKEKLLEELDEHTNYSGYLIEVKRQLRKGLVDYSVLPELIGVNLDRYRKSQSVRTSIVVKDPLCQV